MVCLVITHTGSCVVCVVHGPLMNCLMSWMSRSLSDLNMSTGSYDVWDVENKDAIKEVDQNLFRTYSTYFAKSFNHSQSYQM